ncbi:hemerythrin domain-containing protein [Streptomyces sp. 8K308]|uniref:hemerythrin domain-containing protein n=1 Tax=Streptomyces sp. 8K308 TaxID=2530388 RepID=UPI00104477D6|nr:hemerythrin domain-containing protein [Streptomyces sp. 8K308]TDC06608.1 hemerythrin domain-containing protein [Streptomyces sp. 8K308]
MADVTPDDDIIAVLMRQHGDIRNLFDEVEHTTGEERRNAFRRLVRLLATHETAEEEVIHPYARDTFDGGEEVVAERLTEEREAKELLARLDSMDSDADEFLRHLGILRTLVMTHARAEERYEFAQVRRHASRAQLSAMATAIQAAEATAPTRPHPGVESAGANIALGPVAAVVDRTRDAMRRAMGKDSTR